MTKMLVGVWRVMLKATVVSAPPGGSASTDFSQASNSQYVALLFEDF